jgi:glucose-6-phosphate isomerase
MTEEQLLKLKKDIDVANTAKSELTGQKVAIVKQLKDDLQCDTNEKAKVELLSIQKKIDAIDKQIEEGTTKLKEKYQV